MPYAAALITTSWINLTTYLKQLPFSLGIFFVMFTEILITVGKLGFLVVIFLVAFGLGFHILLSEKVKNQKIKKCDIILIFLKETFSTGWWSVIQTFAMMIGELNYGGIHKK